MTDGRAARSGEWDVLELYASLLASLGGGVGDGAGSVGALVDEQVSLLVDEAVKVWSRPGFDTFLSVPALRFTPFDYQLQAARSALRRGGAPGGNPPGKRRRGDPRALRGFDERVFMVH